MGSDVFFVVYGRQPGRVALVVLSLVGFPATAHDEIRVKLVSNDGGGAIVGDVVRAEPDHSTLDITQGMREVSQHAVCTGQVCTFLEQHRIAADLRARS